MKYGDANYNNSKKMMSTKFDKYGDTSFNNREKASITNVDKYGYKTPMKNKNVIEKGKITKFNNHGNENYNNIEKIKRFWEEAEEIYISEFINKTKKTKLEKYGIETYSNPEKMIKTKMDRYGFYYTNSEKMLETKEERGLIFVLDDNWELYKKRVKSITRKNKKKLYENWDGSDYYDGENIKGYLSHIHTHRYYPTIDHKISLYFGYKNDISPEELGSLENLCITKRFINSIKGRLIEENFNI